MHTPPETRRAQPQNQVKLVNFPVSLDVVDAEFETVQLAKDDSERKEHQTNIAGQSMHKLRQGTINS
eukprot:4659029-Amphidinium_carterae.1